MALYGDRVTLVPEPYLLDQSALFMFFLCSRPLIKRRKNIVETFNLGVGCFVLVSKKNHEQTNDMQRHICFIVFSCTEIFEPLCLSRSWPTGTVCCADLLHVWIGDDLEMLQAVNM